jgi:hypothetical protein
MESQYAKTAWRELIRLGKREAYQSIQYIQMLMSLRNVIKEV